MLKYLLEERNAAIAAARTIAEKADKEARTLAKYVYGSVGDAPLLRFGAAGKPVYYLVDAMDSIGVTVDGTGHVGCSAGVDLDAAGNWSVMASVHNADHPTQTALRASGWLIR